jgi:hypothetical protein
VQVDVVPDRDPRPEIPERRPSPRPGPLCRQAPRRLVHLPRERGEAVGEILEHGLEACLSAVLDRFEDLVGRAPGRHLGRELVDAVDASVAALDACFPNEPSHYLRPVSFALGPPHVDDEDRLRSEDPEELVDRFPPVGNQVEDVRGQRPAERVRWERKPGRVPNADGEGRPAPGVGYELPKHRL